MHVLFAITDHGYGHGARQMAVAKRLLEREPRARVTFWSMMPRSIFAGFLGEPGRWSLQPVKMDVGVAQADGITHDLDETLERLAALWSGDGPVPELTRRMRASGADRVVADVPPAALRSAAELGLPRLASTNFDWAFIYGHYAASDARFAPWSELARAAHAVTPLALRMFPGPELVGFPAVREIGIVSRLASSDARSWRDGVARRGERLVLLSFGGFGLADLERRLPRVAGVRWITAPPLPPLSSRDDASYVPDVAYPSLVAGCDVVFSKPGYGTIAEAAGNRTRFLYAARADFPETPPMVEWLEREMTSLEIPPERLEPRGIAAALDAILAMPERFPERIDGADRAVDEIVALRR